MIMDAVDVVLGKQDGLIQRPRGSSCLHGAKQRCSHCTSLDPFDSGYLQEKGIKHMSFHAYLRKLGTGQGISRSLKYPLENFQVQVKQNCANSHLPYPKGVCSKCQPSTMMLNRQPYRHVDNVSFENELLVNNFLDYWRLTGQQRIGILIGQFEPHSDVPLGIKAVVSAIYEPRQITHKHKVELMRSYDDQEDFEDINELIPKDVLELCTLLNLQPVGWIFTDLIHIPKSTKVKYTRGKDSYFLTAEECLTAAWMQNLYPNKTDKTVEGTFGSKFVTVVASGDESNNVHFSGYQMSNQCSALVAADLLLPVQGRPELAYVRDKGRPLRETQYIPDVNYMAVDQYGNQVTKEGRPLPLEYLLVDVPAGSAKNPKFTFNASDSKRPFPIENRVVAGQLQSIDTLKLYMRQFSKASFLECAMDFHLLVYLVTNDIVKFSLESIQPLAEALLNRDESAAALWDETNEQWKLLKSLMAASEEDDIGSTRATYASSISRPASVATGLAADVSSVRSAMDASSVASSRSSSSVSIINSVSGDQQQRRPAGPSQQSGPASGSVGEAPPIVIDGDNNVWACPICTFENTDNMQACAMCGIPKDAA